ncbi:MAG: tetratricopeptide repeat protein, partial [Gemmatimonadales bacterium]
MRDAAFVAGLIWVPTLLVAQAQPIQTNNTSTPLGRATMAERNGAYADAARQYTTILRAHPASMGALIGMEHVLPRLDRRAELVPLVEAALAADSTSIGIFGVAVRTFAAAGQPDSARKYTERWADHAPRDDQPFREWLEAATEARDLAQARMALDLGRQRLGADALSIERAGLLQRAGDIVGATQEWLSVVRENPPFRDGAIGQLAQVTPAQRQLVRKTLQQDSSSDARLMLGLLVGRWGESADAVAFVTASLPPDSASAVAVLRELLDELRLRFDKPSRLATASVLEAIAHREAAPASTRTLVDAARAYADADDERDARRVLAIVATQPGGSESVPGAGSTTLVQVLIAEGKAADAEKALAKLGPGVDPDEHDRLARRIAMSWVRAGDLARADALIVHDSSTDGFDLRGRLRLYRGDLAGANDLLKTAGPYADVREQALERITLLTLIQAIGVDSLPALGEALITLERGDSARAIRQLGTLAGTLKPGGAAETRLLAARVALAVRDTAGAVAFLRAADVKESPAAAAAARLGLARIDVAAGRVAEARTGLERLIIDFPESAVVPE